MAHDDLLRDVERYYSGKVREHGATAAGVDWNGEASQRLRFRQLLRVREGAPGRSLIDWGCGYGALADELGADVEYHGYDVSAAMLDAARERHGARGTFTDDPATLREADHVVASGIFGVKQEASETDWGRYVADTLDAMAARARHGFAFNMLTSWSDADRMRPDLFYGDPAEWFSHCKRTYAKDVALLHDYGLYEFTILVRLTPPPVG